MDYRMFGFERYKTEELEEIKKALQVLRKYHLTADFILAIATAELEFRKEKIGESR